MTCYFSAGTETETFKNFLETEIFRGRDRDRDVQDRERDIFETLRMYVL